MRWWPINKGIMSREGVLICRREGSDETRRRRRWAFCDNYIILYYYTHTSFKITNMEINMSLSISHCTHAEHTSSDSKLNPPLTFSYSLPFTSFLSIINTYTPTHTLIRAGRAWIIGCLVSVWKRLTYRSIQVIQQKGLLPVGNTTLLPFWMENELQMHSVFVLCCLIKDAFFINGVILHMAVNLNLYWHIEV